MQCLRLADVIKTDGECSIDELVHLHHTFSIEDYTDELGEDLGLQHLHWKDGSNALIVLIGDVVDNYRYGREFPHENSKEPLSRTKGPVNIANMAMDAEMPILRTLIRLKKEAHEAKGDIIWVMGNHDVSSVMRVAGARRFVSVKCSHYTTLDQCNPKHTSLYSEERSSAVRGMMLQMGAVVACEVDNILVCHGGVSKTFVDSLPKGGQDLTSIVGYYHSGVFHSKPESMAIINRTDDLTWFRPFEVDVTWSVNPLKEIDNKYEALVVAHTALANSGMFKEDGAKKPSDGYDMKTLGNATITVNNLLTNGRVVGTDVGMSRAFNQSGDYTKETLCSLSILCYFGKEHSTELRALTHSRCIAPPAKMRPYIQRNKSVTR